MTEVDELSQQLERRESRRGVRLLRNWGVVSASGQVARPDDSAEPAGGPYRGRKLEPGSSLFHVVDTGTLQVAVLDSGTVAPLAMDVREAMREGLLRHYGLVVVIDADAQSVALARCTVRDLDLPTAVREAGLAIWGVKALGGWDESSRMTFVVFVDPREPETLGRIVWLSASCEWDRDAWLVTTRTNVFPWKRLVTHIPGCGDQSYLVVFDVDSVRVFNDAYGHLQGDLMLARVDTVLHAVAVAVEADLVPFRVEGNQFAVRVSELDRAESLAERGRSAVESLAIPLQHPEVETSGLVTVSAAVLPVGEVSTLERRTQDALYEAKRRGRNRVYVSPE